MAGPLQWWDQSTIPDEDWPNTTYDGNWTLHIDVPNESTKFRMWDGDLDFGSADLSALDTDDPNTTGLPVWFNGLGSAEGIAVNSRGQQGVGSPPDNNYTTNSLVRRVRSPAITYTVEDADGNSYVNDDPSGNSEWELFQIDSTTSDQSITDAATSESERLPAGLYSVHISGMDLANLNAFRFEHDVCGVLENGTPNCAPGGYIVGDFVWHDQDGDAVQDPTEPGIAGVLIELLDSDGNVVLTTETDADGYCYFNVDAGEWITRVAAVNARVGEPLEGCGLTTNSDFLTRTILDADDLTYDYGYNDTVIGTGDAVIGNLVWYDVDGDGVYTPNTDTTIDGVVIELYHDANDNGVADPGEYLGSRTTGENANPGEYLFKVQEGTYIVVVAGSNFDSGEPLFGLVQSTIVLEQEDEGSQILDQNRVYPYGTTVETQDLTADFAFINAGSIGDLVWYDINRNGILDDGEPGEAGIEVELWLDSDNDGVYVEGTDEWLATETTDSDGNYLFTGLSAGNYFVVIQSGEGPSDSLYGDKTVSPPDRGGDDTVDSDGFLISGGDIVSGQIQLAAGESDLTVDLGFYIGDTLCVRSSGHPSTVGAYTNFYIDTIAGTVTLRTTLWPSFSDTAYGNASKDPLLDGGKWPGNGRQFHQIVSSDNLRMRLYNGATPAALSMDFTMDLLAHDGSGGYVTAGIDPAPGQSDGSCATGCSYVLDVDTSPSQNYNELGWTNTSTSPDPGDQPAIYNDPDQWIKLAWHEVTVDLDAFGSSGFGTAQVTELHLSPAKVGPENPTVGPCPPGWEDDYEDFQDQYGGSYGLAPAGGDQPAPRLVASCSTCSGNVTMLTLKYTGNGKKDVLVQQKVGNGYYQVYQGNMKPGESFAFSGADASGTFGAELKLFVNGKLDATIKTDCTQSIGPGLVSGSFEVVEGYSLNGGLLCPLNP